MQPTRILLKLSGEALKGSGEDGIHIGYLQTIGQKVAHLYRQWREIVIVVWAGNIFRGASGETRGIERATWDYIGMIATMINGLALAGMLEHQQVPAKVLSSLNVPQVAELFIRKQALQYLSENKVIICVWWTGNPFFTTDSAAVLRALELECDFVVKWTKVDGIYDRDPHKFPDAKRYTEVSFADAIADQLHIMDPSAIALARDEDLPLFVCRIDAIDQLWTEHIVGTWVKEHF
jgi:uridylate kinase